MTHDFDELHPGMDEQGGQAVDLDGDGIDDAIGYDTDGDGVTDTLGIDLDGDGQIDSIASDTDDDGQIDTLEIGVATEDIEELEDSSHTPEDILESSEEPQHGYDVDHDGIVSYMEFETDSSHVGREAHFNEEEGILYPPTFDADSGNDDVIGEPASDMEHWHMQTNPDTCAVVSQEYILEDLLGRDFDENELADLAMENGWYTPGGGTPMEDVGNILEYYGLDVQRGSGTVESLETALANGDKVIVGIDANEVWTNGDDATADHFLEDITGIPDSDCNHAVEVIGIDHSDPDNPMVILNDPGHPGGQGAMVPLELFEDAWADSGNYMVTAV